MTESTTTESTTTTNTADSLGELLPRLFTGAADGPFGHRDLHFEPLVTDGRVGAEICWLYSTKETGENGPAAAVVRYLPGAAAPAHLHSGHEVIYVFSGELETDDGTYGPNSLLVMQPGSVHSPRSPKGCMTFVVWEKPVRRL
ncbi:cupin domain-containing protein [Pseudonocardia sp. TRM90224]|uniref:cupin domain-containing protein n=1 Tax=Pseudonocardia sp. TRM90224 TaxID=2812678 RepID=UPI001E55CF41|nr:cupin domain-containing protein [Pseudonocardia sp. TRM90224]